MPNDQRQNLWQYLKRAPGESSDAAPELLRLAWSSVAALALAPLQDVLNLGADARMNIPGRAEDNWRWRCAKEQLSAPAFQWLADLTESSKRSPLGFNTWMSRCSEGDSRPVGRDGGAMHSGLSST